MSYTTQATPETVEFIRVVNGKVVFNDGSVEKRKEYKIINDEPIFQFKNITYKLSSNLKTMSVILNGNETKVVSAPALTPLQSEFDINDRFNFLSKFTDMVIDGLIVSQIVAGEGGLGKTHSVLASLNSRGLKKDEDYIVVKGFATAKALYATLYENNGKIIVFDDCDSVLKDPIAQNILKGALDSYDERTVSWLSKGFIDDGLPSSFEFEGQIIFISNLPGHKIDGAIKSRSMMVDLSMTLQDKIQRMQAILPNVLPEIDLELKQEVLDFMAMHAYEAVEFNMRTLQKSIKVKFAYGDSYEWENAVKYLLTNA